MPDSAWLATATPGLKNSGSICPQLFHGSPGWSQTVESPARKTVTASGSGVMQSELTLGRGPLNSSVSFLSHARRSLSNSRGLRPTFFPFASLGVRVFTVNSQRTNPSASGSRLSTINRRSSALTVSGSRRPTIDTR